MVEEIQMHLDVDEVFGLREGSVEGPGREDATINDG